MANLTNSDKELYKQLLVLFHNLIRVYFTGSHQDFANACDEIVFAIEGDT